MQASQSLRVTIPAEIVEEFEKVRRAEKRSPSEMVREAVRSYLSFLRHFPEIPPARAEQRAIRRGREAYARGEYVGLDAVLQMELGRNPSRRKKPKQASRKG